MPPDSAFSRRQVKQIVQYDSPACGLRASKIEVAPATRAV